ncbi:MAG: hypothetical protein EBT12_09740 [Marivivens sp.]|nr:hypothetical protein [Marivivens sp.]
MFCDKSLIFFALRFRPWATHNLKVAGSNPAPATNKINDLALGLGHFFLSVRKIFANMFDFRSLAK